MPFDDSDHKRLVKQVEKKVQFPSIPDVSKKCRILIVKILTKASDRVPLKSIKSDPWFQEQKALQVLNETTDPADVNSKSIPNVIYNEESTVSNFPEAPRDNVNVELSSDTPDTQNMIQVHSVESHEVLNCEEESDAEDNG